MTSYCTPTVRCTSTKAIRSGTRGLELEIPGVTTIGERGSARFGAAPMGLASRRCLQQADRASSTERLLR